jgi:hypothetical protein
LHRPRCDSLPILPTQAKHDAEHGGVMCFDDFVGMQDYDGQPIPLHEHQDGFEFFNRLVDQVQKTQHVFLFCAIGSLY